MTTDRTPENGPHHSLHEQEWKYLPDESAREKLREITAMTLREAEGLLHQKESAERLEIEPKQAAEEEPARRNPELEALNQLVVERNWEEFDRLLGITPEAIEEILHTQPWLEIAEASGPIAVSLEEDVDDPARDAGVEEDEKMR